MQENNTETKSKEINPMRLFLFRFIPYWPLFAFLFVVCGAGAWLYLKSSQTVYEISATLLLKDEKKGVEDSKITSFLNMYGIKSIVENELEVIRSRTVIKEVINNLHLYAPVREESTLKSVSAYTSSPIAIEAKDPQHVGNFKKIYFSYTNGGVRIDSQLYLLNQWVNTPYGVLRFIPNVHKNREPKDQLYFSLVSPKIITDGILINFQVVAASRLATVMNLKLLDEVPEKGEDILNGIIDTYNRTSVKEKNDVAANSLAFVDDRLKTVGAGLDSIERTIQQFKTQKGAVDISEQGKLFLQNVGDNDRKLAEINSQLAVLDQVESYVASKNNKTGIVPATLGVDDPVLKQLLQRLSEAELQYESLRQTIPENNSVLVSLRKEIEQIRPGILENIHNLQTNLRASKSNMSASGNAYSSVLQTLPYKERKLLEISRQQSIMSLVYSFLLQKREEMALSNAASVADSQIVDMGESSVLPVSPKKQLIYLIGIVLALGLGIAIISVKEFLGSKILFRSDLEDSTKFPIAAEIANVRHKDALVIDQPEKEFIAEQFRQLVATMGLYNKPVSARRLLITSSIAGEGKSFIATNLALSLAGSGKRVVLLDMDLRKPQSSSLFGLAKEKGMSEYLNGECEINDIIKLSEYSDLYIIPAGAISNNPTKLLVKGNLTGLFSYLDSTFDFIVVDTSPVDPVTDAVVIARYCDKTLFVVRHDYTRKTLVQLLDKNKKVKALPNLSIVFNGVKKRGFLKGSYGFGYGFGYEFVYKQRDLGKKRSKYSLN